MSIMSLIFTTGSGILLLISSLLKIISIKESSNAIYKITFFPKTISKLLGYLFPFLELLISILLILRMYDLWVNTVAILIISVFVIINANAIFKHNNEECFCFGKFMKSRMGIGGLIQSSLLLFSLLPNILFNNSNVITVLSFQKYNFEFIVIIITILLWVISLMLIRTTIDKLLISEN
ncbi:MULTISPECIES: MauE/DoxX family redox-associated membrane protein [Bacillus]|uniref:MauE/DoxX family redox-associated membrane protein n=1 Tax=Bacillus TaxID=1386 RepID=UPI0002797423|nr:MULTISPECIES: MauE/DoxX family redox-associated membrane protein [Bacillus cereus group]EJR04047.1 hypothetical protein II5_03754 [Bacillus cereus MSX-A1]MBV6678946.1 hypothetical protein [Bacillus thuringiensis]MCH5447008.1 hypothetical protein [Bacillus cereus]MDR4154441.1 hypothetical protein [Bacillus cereus]MEB9936246.1 hypothetical protein [Bacillus cereus]